MIGIIHFTTVICHSGLSRITDSHCANKNGLYRRLAGDDDDDDDDDDEDLYFLTR